MRDDKDFVHTHFISLIRDNNVNEVKKIIDVIFEASVNSTATGPSKYTPHRERPYTTSAGKGEGKEQGCATQISWRAEKCC